MSKEQRNNLLIASFRRNVKEARRKRRWPYRFLNFIKYLVRKMPTPLG
jgi:hypothetical protein